MQTFSPSDLLTTGTIRCVYTLHASNDPQSKPRYVGITNNPKIRASNHNCPKNNGRRGKWVRELISAGAKAVITVVFKFRSDDLKECTIIEAQFIENYRAQYSDLLNDAGAGIGIAKMSKWHKDAISRGNKGKKKSPEHAAKCRVARLGIPHSPEIRKKISEGGKGKRRSPEQRENYRKAWVKRKQEEALFEAAQKE